MYPTAVSNPQNDEFHLFEIRSHWKCFVLRFFSHYQRQTKPERENKKWHQDSQGSQTYSKLAC